jgi:hypothetical protein
MDQVPKRAVLRSAEAAICCLTPFLVGTLAGCFPFFRGTPEPPRTPEVVQRFANETESLGIAPAPPRLVDITYTLARAVEALPAAPGAIELGRKIEIEAKMMDVNGSDSQLPIGQAHRSLTFALQAIDKMKRPAGSKSERKRSIEAARRAVGALDTMSQTGDVRTTVEDAYRALAHAMLVVTGGSRRGSHGGPLAALVARFAVEDVDQARRTGAQALYAIAAALEEVTDSGKAKRFAGELRDRAERLTGAAALAYAGQFKDALGIVSEALSAWEEAKRLASLEVLQRQVRPAIDRIDADRPFELQRAVVQDALRLIADLFTVASARRSTSKEILK